MGEFHTGRLMRFCCRFIRHPFDGQNEIMRSCGHVRSRLLPYRRRMFRPRLTTSFLPQCPVGNVSVTLIFRNLGIYRPGRLSYGHTAKAQTRRGRLGQFKPSTSSFDDVEEKHLNIHIRMSSFEDVIRYHSMPDVKDLPETMQDLILPGMNGRQMELIDLYERTDLNELQTSFIYRMQQVIENNKSNWAVQREERYIDVLIFELLKACKLSDGREFALEPSRLYLQVKNRRFAALADWQCSRGCRLLWVVHKNKHIATSTYKSGDIQLTACMLAAYQQNYNVLEEYYPDTMLGMKVKGDKLEFFRMLVTPSYMQALETKLPKEELLVLKTPALKLSNPDDRLQVLLHLWSIRNEGLQLKNVGRI